MNQSFVLNFIIGILEQVFKLSKALECLRGVDPYLSLMYVVFSSRTIIILWSRRKGCASVKPDCLRSNLFYKVYKDAKP